MTTPNNTVAGLAEKLLPCPFCGTTRHIDVEPWFGESPEGTSIQCFADDCPANPSVEEATRAEAIAAWNLRASPAPSAGVGVDEPFDAADNAEYIEHCADKLEGFGHRVTAGALRVIAAEYRALQHHAAPSVSPAVAGDAGELPELPRPDQEVEFVDEASGRPYVEHYYTADQMRAYGEQCRRLATAEQRGSAVQGEAVATLHADGYWTWKGTPPHESNHAGWRMDVFASPPPAPDAEPLTVESAPVGTRAPAIMGGHWYKTLRGWKWNGPDGSGGVFPRPGGDWTGKLIAPAAEQGNEPGMWMCYGQSYGNPLGGCQPEACGVEGMVLVPRSQLVELQSEYLVEGGKGHDLVTAMLAAAPSGVRVDDAMVERLGKRAYEVYCETPIREFPNNTHAPKWQAVVRMVIEEVTALSANEVSRG